MNICVDASLVVKWLFPEEGSEEALVLLRTWRKKETALLAPSLLDYEIGSTVRQKIARGWIRQEDLYPLFDFYRRLNLQLLHLVDLIPQGVLAATSLNQSTIYDVSYLLVAKQQDADLFTADRKFYEAASPLHSFVRFFLDAG